MSMAWSIESRVPLLDYRIVELSARIPSWYKIRRGTPKSILREAVRGLVPDEILDRRDKKGYPVPTTPWFRGPLADYIRNVMAAELLCADYVDVDVARRLAADHASGHADHGATLWKILNLELWMRGLASGWRGVAEAA